MNPSDRAFAALPAHVQAAARRHPSFKAREAELNKKHVHEYRGVRFRSKTEMLYAQHLDGLHRRWVYEGVTFKLADGLRYTPDFVVLADERPEFHEVKGFWRDDAKAKFKVARTLYHYMGAWRIVTAKRLRDGGGFEVSYL